MIDALTEFALVNKYFLYLVLTVFVVESTLGVFLFVKLFMWDKSDRGAFFHAELDSAFYFLFVNGSMLFDLFYRDIEYQSFSFLCWIALTGLMTFFIYQFVDKFQMTKSRKRKRQRRRKRRTKRKNTQSKSGVA